MNVSMDGLRKDLSNKISHLRVIVEAVTERLTYDNDEFVDAMNDVIMASNVLNCVYDDKDPDFSDLSDIEVELLEGNE